MKKKIEKNNSKQTQLTINKDIKIKDVKDTPPLLVKPIRVNTIKQAKKLLSRLIWQLQTEEIKSQKAKDITYLLSVFLTVIRDSELEERIKTLEERIGLGK